MGKELYEIFFDGASTRLLMEIVLRTIIMFILILSVLRVSGRRGVRQLTLFEVAIILGLGSAAGDPMIQQDLPIFHSILVFLTIILVYKLITWLVARYKGINKLLEGEPLIVVRDGRFAVAEQNASNFSNTEFFSELRNASVEHLGQVRIAVLEIDGSMSVLKYNKEEIKFGLPLFPGAYKEIKSVNDTKGPFACMYCGCIVEHLIPGLVCGCCEKDRWTIAINSTYP